MSIFYKLIGILNSFLFHIFYISSYRKKNLYWINIYSTTNTYHLNILQSLFRIWLFLFFFCCAWNNSDLKSHWLRATDQNETMKIVFPSFSLCFSHSLFLTGLTPKLYPLSISDRHLNIKTTQFFIGHTWAKFKCGWSSNFFMWITSNSFWLSSH